MEEQDPGSQLLSGRHWQSRHESLKEGVVGLQLEEGVEEALLVSLGSPNLVRAQAGGKLAAQGTAG